MPLNLDPKDIAKLTQILTDSLKAAGFGNNNGNVQVQEILRRKPDGTPMSANEIDSEIKQVLDIMKDVAKGQRENQKQLNRDDAREYYKKLVKDGVGKKWWDIAGREEKKRALIAREKATLGYSKTEMKESSINSVINKISAGLESIGQIATAVTDGVIAAKRNNLKSLKNSFDYQQKLFQAQMDMSNAVTNSVVTTITSMGTQTALEASRAISSAANSEANARIKYIAAQEMAIREFDIAEAERKVETVKAEAAAASGALKGVAGIASLFGPIGMAVGAVITGLTSIGETAVNVKTKIEEFDIEKTKQETEIYNTLMSNVTAVADKMKTIVEGIDSTANAITDKMLANETIYKQAGLLFGFAGNKYSSYMQKIQVEAARIFNITAEEMAQMQKSYIDASGRNVMMGVGNYNQIESISRTFGIGNQEVSAMFGEMNIFNTSISDGYDMMNDMWHVATKLGLSTSKFSKDLTENLKLAQKYNFKGGVENMAKLTMWAEKTRFNLQNATNFADKMMSNNISEVLETSAKLQVLGGNAAMYADPMAMMWEAGNDVGALAKRQAAMFADITGTFDKITGETRFSEFDLRMIKARAEAMGMNYEDVLSQKRQSNKQGVINKALAAYNLDDDTLTGIGNRATYNKKRGEFTVKTIDDRELSINEVAQMTDKDRQRLLMPENTDDAIMNIAKDTRSLVQLQEAQMGVKHAETGLKMWGNITEAVDMTMKSYNKLFGSEGYVEQLKKSVISQAENTKAEVDATIKFINENAGSIKNYRDFVKNNIRKSMALQGAEISILSILAKQGGIETLSHVMGSVSAVLSENNAKKRNTMITQLRSKATEEEKDAINVLLSVNNSIGNTNDAVGLTKGGYLAGASVTPINDGVGTLVKTHPNDQFIAAKSGGPIDKLFDVVSNIINKDGDVSKGNGALEIKLSGNINLQDSNGKINLVDMIKNDPVSTREFIRILMKAIDVTNNGKTSKNHMI